MAQKVAGRKSLDDYKRALLKDHIDREAFEMLTTRWGVDETRLLSLLSKIPLASDEPIRLVEGMEGRAVRKLPGQIRNWADAIEKVNASPWLGPRFLRARAASGRFPKNFPEPLNWTMSAKNAELVARRFHFLPSSLRLYADYLLACVEFFHPMGQRRRDLDLPQKQPGLKKWLTLELLTLVRHQSGQPRYSQVAILLNRAYHLAGNGKVDTEEKVDKEDLIQLEKNNPWITWVLHEANMRTSISSGV